MRNESIAVLLKSIANILSLSTVLALGGCGEKVTLPVPRPTVARFSLTHHAGGTHSCVLINGEQCITAFGCSVQVIDPRTLAVIHDVALGEFGHCGPVVDLAVSRDRLFAVIEDDAVVELSLAAGAAPKIERVISSESLGIRPRRLSVVNNAVYASGIGGVINVTTGDRAFNSEDDCGHVARGTDGLLVCMGRRVNRVSDGHYVGAASDLLNLPPEDSDKTAATLLFALQGEENALGGLMTPNVREVGGKGTIAMPQRIERVRNLGGQVFFVGSQRIDWYDIKADALESAGSVSILGARDVARLDPHTLIIAGTFGRAAYRVDERDATSGQFIAAQREASQLTFATSDGLSVVAGSKLGAWMYQVNSRAELTARTIESAPPGPRSANTVVARAEISADGGALKVTPAHAAAPAPSKGSEKAAAITPVAEPWEYREEKGAKLHTVIAVAGDFWIGHDRGITILRADGGQSLIDPKAMKEAKSRAAAPPTAEPVRERLRLPGAVKYLFPLLAGKGASYVSEYGGFGAARFIDEVKE